MGAGYVYIGKIKKAFFFLIVPILVLLAGLWIEKYIDFAFFFSAFMAIALILYSYVDIWKSFPISDEENLMYSKWYYVTLFMLLGITFSFLIKNQSDNLPTQHFNLPSSSMNKTLFKGDLIMGERKTKLHRGDIAIFRYPSNPDIYYIKRVLAIEDDEIIYQDKKLFIHFHEGDKYIEQHFPSNSIYTIREKLWIKNPYQLSNPNIIYEPKKTNAFQYLLYKNKYNEVLYMQGLYIKELSSNDKNNTSTNINAFYAKVKKKSYFMVGDNRDASNDSRFFGSVPQEYIYGILKNVYFNYLTWDRFNIHVE